VNDDRLEFYDPLYETIVFERGLPPSGFTSEDPLDPRDIVQTAEFARLAFLNQVGLAWLVFPSATHTRFAHSIGCWWLGRIAESLIKVQSAHGPRSLHQWLCLRNLREEFYLALLLHDVGHGPLSHVLERNPQFTAVLQASGLRHWEHEHRGADLLLGSGPVAEIWQEVARERYGSRPTFSDLRSQLAGVDNLCIHAVCYLMTGSSEYLSGCCHDHKEDLAVVKELVSGLLDLDRLDHYARDSYFSGLRQVSINVRGFLTNLRVEPHSDGALISLSRDGVGAAASLLFSKRQILTTMFRHPKTVSLHTMANSALSKFLESVASEDLRLSTALRVAWMEDYQFLDAMSKSVDPYVHGLVRRIRALNPYSFVGRWVRDDIPVDATESSVVEFISEYHHRKGNEILCHFDDGFWTIGRISEPKDWLDSSRLITDDTRRPLTDHPDHRDDFSFLREAAKRRCVWFFASDAAGVDEARQSLTSFLRARPV
jgi:HD superfamily phosphohydrolase